MNSIVRLISELEARRTALNERLMNSKTVAEANRIERELWALRARVRYYGGALAYYSAQQNKAESGSHATDAPNS